MSPLNLETFYRCKGTLHDGTYFKLWTMLCKTKMKGVTKQPQERGMQCDKYVRK
jgi:hypothetical protein